MGDAFPQELEQGGLAKDEFRSSTGGGMVSKKRDPQPYFRLALAVFQERPTKNSETGEKTTAKIPSERKPTDCF